MKLNCLPLFPDFTPLSLEHGELFRECFKLCPTVISELNFTELFMWRDSHKIKLCRLRDNLCVLIEKGREHYFYQPVGGKQVPETVRDMLEWFKSGNIEGSIYGVDSDTAELLRCSGREFIIKEDRDISDYVYLSSDLTSLKGRKYDGKRNQIAQFMKNYKYESIPITQCLVPDCLKFQEKWCRMRGCTGSVSLAEENTAVEELLDNYSGLEVSGILLKINSEIEAITVGGELNPETAVIHIEKANPKFKGIYQTINRLFCEKLPARYKYINREQDMGNAGLRKAKLSYHPDHLVCKYSVRLKEGSR